MMPPRTGHFGCARALRSAMTPHENRLWYFLRNRGVDGARFRRQVPLGPYIADFVCIERSLVIEVDRGQHGDATAYDAKRTAWLEARGWRVLRFWNNEVAENISGVLDQIRAEIETRASFPLPALPRERGRNQEEKAAP